MISIWGGTIRLALVPIAAAVYLSGCSTDDSNTAKGAAITHECGADLDTRETVELVYSKEAAPSSTGGVLVGGTYYLTRWVAYGTPEPGPSRQLRATFQIDTDGVGFALGAEGNRVPQASAFKWEMIGQNLVLEHTCPASIEGRKEGRPYSASPTEVSFFTDDGTVLTYSKR